MGAQQGKPDQNTSSIKLTESERQQLKATFTNIVNYSQTGSFETPNPDLRFPTVCQTGVFKTFCSRSLDDFLAQQISLILEVLSKSKDSSQITFNGFCQFISNILKGDFDKKIECIFSMCSASKSPSFPPQNTITGDSILKLTTSIVKSYIWHSFHDTPALRSWSHCQGQEFRGRRLAEFLLQDLLYPSGPPKDLINKEENIGSRQFTLDELVTGLGKSLLFQNIFNSVFSNCFKFDIESNVTKNIVPQCLRVQPTLLPSNFTMLDQESVMFLNSHLPSQLQSKWRFLFSSAAHGENFSKFLDSIQGKGATLLIVKDLHGRIFGGFAPSCWKLGPKFLGTSQSFLFHLAPRFLSYSTTGYNENFQYLNMGQKTLPNGLGMGGTLEYFGLWIDSEFGKGICSPSCTTYACPQLSVKKEFSITRLEAWGVGPEPEKEEGVRDPRSVLDKDPELRAVLEVLGKKVNASDGYRDIEPID